MKTELVEDEDVSFYAELCNDDNLASFTRQYLMSLNDKMSQSTEECYLRNTISNKKVLAGIAERELNYERARKEQTQTTDML